MSPTPTPRPSRPSIWKIGWTPSRPEASTRFSMTTPRVAPTGSRVVLSQRRIVPVGWRARSTPSRGPTTVGPETMRMAPIMNAMSVRTS